MARMRTDSLDGALAEPVIGFERNDEGRPALPRLGPATSILIWIAACAALWGLFAAAVTVL